MHRQRLTAQLLSGPQPDHVDAFDVWRFLGLPKNEVVVVEG